MSNISTQKIQQPQFEHVPVKSSNLKSAAWADHVLEVKFHSGATYRYFNVPKSIFNDLVDPDLSFISKGQYFNKRVKDVYKWQKI